MKTKILKMIEEIPTNPILQFLYDVCDWDDFRYHGQRTWGNWYFNNKESVTNAMPKNTPGAIVVLKMRDLIDKDLVDGCGCGCRGDYMITEKGRDYLEAYHD